MTAWEPSRLGESYTLKLSQTLIISVIRGIGTKNGPPPEYRITLFGTQLANAYATADDAKWAALKFARSQFAMAIATLEKVEA